jgi:hypothetical protein
MLFSLSVAPASAQAYLYQARQFAMKTMTRYGTWTDWSDWEKSEVRISIDFDTDVIRVYTQMTQKYVVVEYLGNYTDQSGGKQRKFRVIDQDGDVGTIRIRIETNGNSQLYVEFADIMWVYSGLIRLN